MTENNSSLITRINLGETAPIKLKIDVQNNKSVHWHSYIELIYVLSGSLEVSFTDRKYNLSGDDLLLINPFEMHSFQSEGCMIAFFQIYPALFDRYIINSLNLKFDCNSSLLKDKSKFYEIKKLMAKFIKVSLNNDFSTQLLSKSYSYAILYELTSKFSIELNINDSYSTENYIRMEKILEYINKHYHEKISLKSIANETFLSEPYISRLFKQNLGINFSEYLSSIRLSQATNELLTTNDSIEIISDRCGFPNPRAFSMVFKKEHAKLPGAFRKQLDSYKDKDKSNYKSEQASILNFEHNNFLGHLARFLETETSSKNEAGIFKKNIIQAHNINNKIAFLRHSFKNTTSIGKAKHILFAKNQEILKDIQKNIGFKYIKFHGLLDDDMMVYSEDSKGNASISFTYIDMILDFLLSINLKPIMQLSFMPQALAKNPERTMFYSNSVISLPKDINKWKFLISSLVNHLRDRYGIKEIKKWPFFLWNEPDSIEELFGFNDKTAFYNFYKSTYKAVKSVDKNLLFGSPSVLHSSIESSSWMMDFMCFCNENNCIPEFLNFHFYPISITSGQDRNAPFKSNLILDQSENALNTSITNIKRIIQENNWNIKERIFMTEWNSTISHRDWLNDTVFKSAYIVKNILENYDQLRSFTYWTVSDLMEELKIPDEVFHGGLGLFTYNGIKKSHYYAFKMLSNLGNTLIGKGDGYFLTKSDRSIEMIFYNYQHFSEIYSKGELFDMTFKNRYTPFSNTTTMLIEMPLNGLENSTYIIKETIINRKFGSAFDIWIENGGLELENEEDVENLKAFSVPKTTKRKVNITENTFTLTVELEPHEVRSVSLYKYKN